MAEIQLTDEQIDRIYGPSKFVTRLSTDKSGYEIVEMMNDDWPDVITDEQEVRGRFDTYDEAETVRLRMHVRFVLRDAE